MKTEPAQLNERQAAEWAARFFPHLLPHHGVQVVQQLWRLHQTKQPGPSAVSS